MHIEIKFSVLKRDYSNYHNELSRVYKSIDVFNGLSLYNEEFDTYVLFTVRPKDIQQAINIYNYFTQRVVEDPTYYLVEEFNIDTQYELQKPIDENRITSLNQFKRTLK